MAHFRHSRRGSHAAAIDLAKPSDATKLFFRAVTSALLLTTPSNTIPHTNTNAYRKDEHHDLRRDFRRHGRRQQLLTLDHSVRQQQLDRPTNPVNNESCSETTAGSSAKTTVNSATQDASGGGADTTASSSASTSSPIGTINVTHVKMRGRRP